MYSQFYDLFYCFFLWGLSPLSLSLRLTEFLFCSFSLCVVDFLHFLPVLHSIKLVHTDLKPENILFRDPAYRPNEQTRCSDSVNNTNSFPGIVIIDFGSATFEDQHHTRIVCTRHYRYALCF